MVLTVHIIIALASLIAGGIAAFRPARGILSTNYGLIAATFASGTLLIIQQPAHIASACSSGLVYLAAAGTLAFIAQRRFVREDV